MKVVKKTSEYTIKQRRDGRYAVTTKRGKPVNGDEKVKILLAEELIKVTEPSAPPEPDVEETADESAAENSEEGGEAADEDAS